MNLEPIDLDRIPEDRKVNFPIGVSEVEYETANELNAFINGLNWPEDVDVRTGTPFTRDGMWVVRVQVGDWSE
jgi:hypothetical protein